MALESPPITNQEAILVQLRFTGNSGAAAKIQPGTLAFGAILGDGSFDTTTPKSDGSALIDNGDVLEFWAVSGSAIDAVTTLNGTVDADTGPGVVELGFQVNLNVVGEQAVGVTGTFGERRLK